MIAQLLKKNRETAGISLEELAKKLSIPFDILAYIEDPVAAEAKIVNLLSTALGISPSVFKGEKPSKPKEPTSEEKQAILVQNALFPNIRKFILDPSFCETPDIACKLFGNEKLTLAEKNVILYLSTTALYNFCDTNSSSFAFDLYLFKLHAPLLARFEKELESLNLSAEEKQDRLDNARGNIFACDTMENIAIRVLEPFTLEMEEKLKNHILDFNHDLDLPGKWRIDETLLRIEIKDTHGNIKHVIKLLDVKGKT